MASIERFLTKRLKLKVNKAKSAVARPSKRIFGFMPGGSLGGASRRSRGLDSGAGYGN